MDKRYQVFVSSTFLDLKEERQEVMTALLELDCIPCGMELFPASDDDSWTLIRKVIDDCDYYIVVLGGRYGSVTAEGISFTEKEYDYAAKMGKPMLVFLHGDPGSIAQNKSETEPKKRDRLLAFRHKAEEQKHCRYWGNASDLGGIVSRSIVKLLKERPAEGWVRARHIASAEALEEMDQYRKRIAQLEDRVRRESVAPSVEIRGLARENDTILLSVRLMKGSAHLAHKVKVTWDAVFGYLGPHIMQGIDEDDFKNWLRMYLELKVRGGAAIASENRVSDSTFQTVKIQLLALGLIRRGDKDRRWYLTPFGETHLLKVRAIKRGQAQPAEDT